MKAQDYRKKYVDLTQQLVSLEAKIKTRLKELVKQHPDVIIGQKGDTMIKAKSISNDHYIDNASVEDVLETIQTIEQWIASQHPHQQLEIKYPTKDPICNCDGRDMPTYMEEGKRWCPQCGYEVK